MMLLSSIGSQNNFSLFHFGFQVDLDLVTEEGWTALLFACQEGLDETVKDLLQQGADASLQAKDGTFRSRKDFTSFDR